MRLQGKSKEVGMHVMLVPNHKAAAHKIVVTNEDVVGDHQPVASDLKRAMIIGV